MAADAKKDDGLVPVKMDKAAAKAAPPRHSPRKVKGFVDTQPVMYRLQETVDERVDQLIRFGLGDPAHLAFYRRALSDPRGAVQSAVYRDYVAQALSRLLEAILSDPSLYLRVRTVLQSRMRGGPMTLEDVARAAMDQVLAEGRRRVAEPVAPAPTEDRAVSPEPTSPAIRHGRKRTIHKVHPREPRKVGRDE